jgi:hypothetical protein
VWRASIFCFEDSEAKQTSPGRPDRPEDPLSGCGGWAIQSKSAGREANAPQGGKFSTIFFNRVFELPLLRNARKRD